MFSRVSWGPFEILTLDILRLLRSYDPGTGMYWCPHEAHKDMASRTRPMYQQQAEVVYTELKEEIGEDNMEVIMATQMCGKESDQKVKGKEDNGISAFFACCPSTRSGERA